MTVEAVKSPEDTAHANRVAFLVKLHAALDAADEVVKDATNTQQGYDYVSAEAMLRKLRPILLEQKLLLIPSLESVETVREMQSRSGGSLAVTRVHVLFELTDIETNESYAFNWAGDGMDSGDKGIYKAYTGALKTFLRDLFLLPMGDDPEKDNGDEPAGASDLPFDAQEDPTPSEKQLNYLRTLTQRVDGAGDILNSVTGTRDLSELTKAQASKAIEALKEKAEKK